jgi:flavin-binding protein dodecin
MAIMAVEKSIDLTSTGTSIEEAVSAAVHRASLTLRGVTGFEVERVEGVVDGEDITYRVLLRVSFVIKEQLHE